MGCLDVMIVGKDSNTISIEETGSNRGKFSDVVGDGEEMTKSGSSMVGIGAMGVSSLVLLG